MSNIIVNTTSYALAMHPYASKKADELAMNPGEVFKVTKKADDGWWFGQKIQPFSDTKGWFPSNFAVEPNPDILDISKPGNPRFAKVEYEYKAREEDELALKPGDLVCIIVSDEDEGWFRGVLNSKLGLFPANFVTLISKAEYDRLLKSSDDTQTASKQLSVNDPKKLQASERRISLNTHNVLSNNVKQELMNVQTKEAAQPPPSLGSKKFAIVTFDYIAQQPDELNLKKGMRIEIISKDEEGWWTGVDEAGNKGVFPYNFVEEIVKPEVAYAKPSKAAVQHQQQEPKPEMNTAPTWAKPQSVKNVASNFQKPAPNGSAPVIANPKPMVSANKVALMPKPQQPQQESAQVPQPVKLTPNKQANALPAQLPQNVNAPPVSVKPVMKFAMPGLAKPFQPSSNPDLSDKPAAAKPQNFQYLQPPAGSTIVMEASEQSQVEREAPKLLQHATKDRVKPGGKRRSPSIGAKKSQEANPSLGEEFSDLAISLANEEDQAAAAELEHMRNTLVPQNSSAEAFQETSQSLKMAVDSLEATADFTTRELMHFFQVEIKRLESLIEEERRARRNLEAEFAILKRAK